MAFPSVAATTDNVEGTAVTSHDIPMPATVDADDLLVMVFTYPSVTITTTDPTGWTRKEKVTHDNSGGANDRFLTQITFLKKADGTEGGTNVTVTTSATSRSATVVHRVTGWSGTLAEVELGTPVKSANSDYATGDPDPPSLTPSGGAQDYLWIAQFTISVADGDPTAPTDYTNLHEARGGGSNAQVVTANRDLNASTEDPSTFGIEEGFRIWVAQTIVVPPAAAAPSGDGSLLLLRVG